MWYTSSDGSINLQITKAEAAQGYHLGQCDNDVCQLCRKPRIARQLKQLNPEDVRSELEGCGAWTDEELADHDANLQRLLWLACADITDEK